MSSWPALAASNNADWCDAVCRTHGIETERDDRAWTSRTRTPPLHPDAVTLVADGPTSELLNRIDASPGCSVKDSFSSLDLSPHGFRVLFDAQWIIRRRSRPAAVPASPRWTVVQDPDGFAVWESAWRGPDGPQNVLRSDLLRTSRVSVLAAQIEDRIVGGAVLCRSAKVVGVSNVFSEVAIRSEVWRGLVALAEALSPGVPLVGYESGDALDAARTEGFEAVGPLQVWLRDG